MKITLETLLIRLRNPKVITALVSGILLLLFNTGIITMDKANHITDIVNILLSLVVSVGVIGNPESHVPVVETPVETTVVE